jgi:hypothetical protein
LQSSVGETAIGEKSACQLELALVICVGWLFLLIKYFFSGGEIGVGFARKFASESYATMLEDFPDSILLQRSISWSMVVKGRRTDEVYTLVWQHEGILGASPLKFCFISIHT